MQSKILIKEGNIVNLTAEKKDYVSVNKLLLAQKWLQRTAMESTASLPNGSQLLPDPQIPTAPWLNNVQLQPAQLQPAQLQPQNPIHKTMAMSTSGKKNLRTMRINLQKTQ